MIRPFHLRDLALVYRLSDHSVVLQAESSLTNSPRPLRRALISMLVGGQSTTYVWKSQDRDAVAFVQVRLEEGETNARLACLAAEADNDSDEADGHVNEDVWLCLLDQLVAELGARGVHSLVAEVSEGGPELPVLRQAGFAVYTRQDIWILDQMLSDDGPNILRPRESVDDWDIHVLYSNMVPRLIQSVEPDPPLGRGQSWILREGDELVAYININGGSAAGWMRVLIHPNTHRTADEVIRAALRVRPASPTYPIYCCVPRYQSWLSVSLERVGFRLLCSQAVMVRHIAQHVAQPEATLPAVLEAQTVPSSSSLVRGFTGRNGKGRGSH